MFHASPMLEEHIDFALDVCLSISSSRIRGISNNLAQGDNVQIPKIIDLG